MPTTKRRLNISLPFELEIAIEKLARRDDISHATEITRLLKVALEIEEDDIWDTLAETRDKQETKLISHHKAWA